METWDAITSRRNVRRYTDERISEHDLERILEAARRTPSSRNEQRWDFVVATDRAQLEDLSRVWRGAGHVARSAATIALIAPKTDDQRVCESIQYDLGQVTMSIALAAVDLGIGTGHAAVSDQDLAREILGFPDDRFCAWLIALGYPGDRPLTPINKPTRRSYEDVVHHARW
jgi:nitroreductase